MRLNDLDRYAFRSAPKSRWLPGDRRLWRHTLVKITAAGSERTCKSRSRSDGQLRAEEPTPRYGLLYRMAP